MNHRQLSVKALRLGWAHFGCTRGGATPIIQVHAAFNVASSAAGAHVLVLHKEMLSRRDDRAYRELYDLVIETLPPPDLLVYLQASVPTLMERIGRRGRGIESGIPADYLERLGALYAGWLEDFNLCPVLTVPADNLDFPARHPFADHRRAHPGQAAG